MTNLIHAKNQIYVLGEGNAGAKRLELQHKILSEESYAHLEKAGLSQGQIVWDIGCGNGMMTVYLAQTVGEKGHVYAVDISDAQLKLAKERIEQEGLQNVTFIQGDIATQVLPEGQADVVYSRFLLMHVPNPELVIKKIKSLLKTGGISVSQENIMSSVSSSFQKEVMQDLVNTLIALGKSKGVDYDIGNKTKTLYQEAKFVNVEEYFSQKSLSAQDAKKAIRMSLNEWKDKALDSNLATSEQIKLWEETIDSFPEDDPSFCVSLGKQAHVLAKK